MQQNSQETPLNQQETKANDGSQGDASAEKGSLFNMQGRKGQDVDSKKEVQHEHRLPENSFFGPYKP